MTKVCPGCGLKMIKMGTGITLSVYPPLYPQKWWCGGCGYEEEAESIRGKTVKDVNMAAWKKANNLD